jgi:hypothetical protein
MTPLFRGLGTFLAALAVLVFLAAVFLFVKRLAQSGNKAATTGIYRIVFSVHDANEKMDSR